MTLSPDPARAPQIADKRVACEHADRCGGCPIIALPYGEQLALKRGRVVQSVARYAALELVYTEPRRARRAARRRTGRAPSSSSAPGGRIGLFAKGGGHQVVDIPGCRVVSPTLAQVARRDPRARVADDEETGGPLAPLRPERRRAACARVDLREVRESDPSDGRASS